jgi:phosphoglycerate dehydrogenase-like enzyme
MKPSAIFIAVARRDTVDESALVHALVGAVLDVFEEEPFSFSKRTLVAPERPDKQPQCRLDRVVL